MDYIGLSYGLKYSRVSISTISIEISKAMEGVRVRAYKGAKSNWFRIKAREEIKRVSRNSVRKVRDNCREGRSIS